MEGHFQINMEVWVDKNNREADANETSGEDGLTLLGSLVGESQLRILKFEPEIMLSNMLPLVSVELKYHDEW